MRQQQKSNRSRGRGNRHKGGGGGGNNMNRVFDSAGPEGKVRGTPQQIIDKYLTLARDAQTSGDRVTAENFLQHAEHYQRILITPMSEQERIRRENAPSHSEDQPDEGQQAASSSTDPQKDDGNGGAVSEAKSQPSEEIGGMAMIDAGGSEPESLVAAPEEAAQPQKRANGEGSGNTRRPRRRSPRPEGENAEQPPAPTTTAEAAEG